MNFEVLLKLIEKMHLYVSIFSKSVKNHKNFSQNQKVTFNNLLGQTLCYEKFASLQYWHSYKFSLKSVQK